MKSVGAFAAKTHLSELLQQVPARRRGHHSKTRQEHRRAGSVLVDGTGTGSGAQGHPTVRSQISHMVADSAWEQFAANLLETSPLVDAYAKNDHLGFQVHYLWNGAKRRYIPTS